MKHVELFKPMTEKDQQRMYKENKLVLVMRDTGEVLDEIFANLSEAN